MELIEISPFIRFAGEVVVPKQKEPSYCADCRLIFINQGNGKLNINSKNYDFSEGALFLWQPMTLYRFIFKTQVKVLVINFDYIYNQNSPKEVIPLISSSGITPNKSEFTIHNFSDAYALNSPITIKDAYFIKDRIIKIIEEFRNKTFFNNANASAYLKLCISKISNTVTSSEKSSEIIKKLDLITDYIHKNINKPLSNDLLANIAGYHPYYLNRIFKQNKGITLHQYILNYKLSLSADLLLSTTSTISEIAEKTGFNNQISFIKAFKKFYNLTPTQFRNKTFL